MKASLGVDVNVSKVGGVRSVGCWAIKLRVSLKGHLHRGPTVNCTVPSSLREIL